MSMQVVSPRGSQKVQGGKGGGSGKGVHGNN